MKIIGLTGGSGTGKSMVAQYLKQKGMYIIDADKIAHEILEKGKPAYYEAVRLFGNSILDENENIVRKKVGNIVFNDKQKLKKHTQYTHKYIIEEIRNLVKENLNKDFKAIVIDAPLLVEANLHKETDEVWAVYADKPIRLERIMERDNLTFEQAQSRIDSQMDWQELKKYADIIIYNNNDFEDVKKYIDTILK